MKSLRETSRRREKTKNTLEASSYDYFRIHNKKREQQELDEVHLKGGGPLQQKRALGTRKRGMSSLITGEWVRYKRKGLLGWEGGSVRWREIKGVGELGS